MPIEFEYFSLTGIVGNTGETGILRLQSFPTTGPNGQWDIGVDPVDGPSQVYYNGTNANTADFGITGNPFGLTGQAALFFNDSLPNSTLRKNLLAAGSAGLTGLQTIRVIYNY
jgi:hypothetical protein